MVFQLISKRSDRLCNFLEGGTELGEHSSACRCSLISDAGKEAKIIYRHYATLYFVFLVDSLESELVGGPVAPLAQPRLTPLRRASST